MEYEQLVKELEQRKFKGYINKDNVKSTGSGSCWGAGALSILGELILMRSFTTNDNESQTMELLEKKLSDFTLRKRELDSYLGNLVSVDEWYEDQDKGLMIAINKGFLFPLKKNKEYIRGFGHPKIYRLEDGERLLDMHRESHKLKTRAIVSISAMVGSVPLYYLVSPIAGYGFMGLTIISGFYHAIKEYRLKEPEPIISGEKSIKKLCELIQ